MENDCGCSIYLFAYFIFKPAYITNTVTEEECGKFR